MSRLFSLLALFGSLALGQVPDTGRIERRGDMATLIVDSPRPLDSAALTLAAEFGIPISVEDPPYLYREDLRELPSASTVAGTSPRRIPKGGKLEVSFKTQSDGSPEDVAALLKALLDQANSRFPFAYRMDGPTGEWVTFVPTQTRDAGGHPVGITALMDRQVTILPGRRSISEHAQLMVASLSTQTGLRLACCQVGVGGIPWGMEVVDFEATQEPARDVLRRLAALSINGRPNGYYWLLRCDDASPSWCFVNLGWATKTAKQQPAPDRPPQAGPERWFTRGSPEITISPIDDPTSLDELTRRSQLIVEGEVVGVQPSRQLNPEQPHSIETDSLVSVKRIIKGSAGVTILIAQMGGTVGTKEAIAKQDPLLKVGEQFFFFLIVDDRKIPNTSSSPRYTSTGALNGKVKIEQGKAQFPEHASPALRRQANVTVESFVAAVQKIVAVQSKR